jgi:N-acetylneuraminic acid mutarotase/uncharacterized protein YegP (UPF0339 family)
MGWVIAALSAVALLGLGLANPAQAAPTVTVGPKTHSIPPVHYTSARQVLGAKKNAVPVCAAAKANEAHCFALRRTDVSAVTGLIGPKVTPAGFGATDLQGAYALPANGGAGQTVAIVDAYDDPNAEADLAIYRQQYGLPPCTTANGCFKKVDQRGGTSYPAGNTGWAGEISLDVDMVSAAAPNAHIVLVEADSANFSDLGTAVDQAVAQGAKYVSNSYGTNYTSAPGSGEDPAELQYDTQYYQHPGVAVVASSGDGDYGVSYPAASQYVTSVGGTSLVKDSSARGWSESVWHNQYGGPGSGCSTVEPKPAFQHDSGCANRTVADVSSVSDPATGVSVYQTYGGSGWAVYGGTSAASPLIAGVYADAGTPAAGSYPNSYPYLTPSALNDVTTGANGTCTPAYLCTAGAGYDGPTGLGTPNGLSAFRTGPHGEVSGTVTDATTGTGIPGASVAVGGNTVTTDATGKYDVTVPAGTYDVTASAFGYASKTVSAVAIADGATVTENFALSSVPKSTVTGLVTDGSGKTWPLYAKITIDGVPGGPVYTDPYTGRYALQLPAGTYKMHVTANYPGYQPTESDLTVPTTDQNHNIAVPVDATTCTAPGYQVNYSGTSQTFDTTSTPAGWTITNGTTGGGWEFDDPGNRGNGTGGSGGFAIVDSDHLGSGNSQDTTLTSPTFDLSSQASPELGFNTYYLGYTNQVGEVDVSTDNGTTWSSAWQHGSDTVAKNTRVDLPLPAAANKSQVKVRFHFTATWGYYWELDNVFVGSRTCDPVHGGLVLGTVTDANTGAGITGALVTSTDAPADNTNTLAAGDDPAVGDGFFWMFSSLTGSHPFTAAKGHYTTASSTVTVAPNNTTKVTYSLKAGQLSITPSTVNKTVKWQGNATQNLTVTNTGTAPATVKIGEQPGGFQLQATGTGAPRNTVAGHFPAGSHHNPNGTLQPSTVKPADATNPSDAPWTSIANYPTPIQDNASDYLGGKLYSAFGYTGAADTSALYVYDPGTTTWTQLASAADTREAPAHGFINGKWYVVGGWGSTGNPDPKLEIYDPSSNTWTTGASSPAPYAGSGTAVLNGKLYVIGGCGATTCGTTDVYVYDPSSNSWSKAANYPESVSWVSAGGVNGTLYTAGGYNGSSSLKHSYSYDASANSWSAGPDLPADLWGSFYTAANGQLLVSGGVTANSSQITNQGYSLNPGTGTWSALANANTTLYRGGSALGFYEVGGNPGGSFTPPVATAEVLPGFDQGGTTNVDWLSEDTTQLTLAPGASGTVKVKVDASVASITQPGTFTASLIYQTDTPYQVAATGVTMTVLPPATWGKIDGTIYGTDKNGNTAPIAGATVQVNTWAFSYTLKTDKNGYYALWLDYRNNTLQVIAAKDGYQPAEKDVDVVAGDTVTTDFTLKADP